MRRRRVGLFFIFGALVPLAVAATAWACGNLATLTVTPKLGAAGSTVTVSGTNYNSAATSSPIDIRLDTRTGPILKSVPPGSSSFSTTVVIPPGTTAGYHLLLGMQNTVSGNPASGTPGRTNFRVTGTAPASSLPVSPWSSAKPSGPGGSGATIAVDPADSGGSLLPTLFGIALSLALLGTGLKLAGRGGPGTANRPLLRA